ncbi:MAG: 16S rRNA (uracil(1498)-N(3))-methyltransferase [Rhodospirillales bacterium]|nr:16S rRNA (uracil(1498)-N(3))-methyltransferase [Rhodospirillales bacterium]
MTESNAKCRLYVATPLSENAPVSLQPAQAHYLRNVLRMQAGDAIAVFNGRDGEWLVEIDRLDKKGGEGHAIRLLRDQRAEPDLWLLFAPIKKARLDFVVEKAVELGVSGLFPVMTANTSVGRVNTDRLRAQAAEAAEQCERLSVPMVAESMSLKEILADWPAGRVLLVLDERGDAAVPIAEAFSRLNDEQGRPVPAAILVGPEGGFASSELDALGKLPIVRRISLGSRILRAETASVSALACWQAINGDWRGSRPKGQNNA